MSATVLETTHTGREPAERVDLAAHGRVTSIASHLPVAVRSLTIDKAAETRRILDQAVELGWPEFKRQWRALNDELEPEGGFKIIANEPFVDGEAFRARHRSFVQFGDGGEHLYRDIERCVRWKQEAVVLASGDDPDRDAAVVGRHARRAFLQIRYHNLSRAELWLTLMLAVRLTRKPDEAA